MEPHRIARPTSAKKNTVERWSEEAADRRRREGEQAEGKDAWGPEWLVDNGGWRRQEQSVDGATSNKRERGEEEDAVMMLAAMLLCWEASGRRH
jgi:hypothetical protein